MACRSDPVDVITEKEVGHYMEDFNDMEQGIKRDPLQGMARGEWWRMSSILL